MDIGFLAKYKIFLKTEKKSWKFQALGSRAVFSNSEVANQSDVLLLSVKPQVVSKVLPEIKESMERQKKLLISIAMGVSLKTLENVSNHTFIELVIRITFYYLLADIQLS